MADPSSVIVIVSGQDLTRFARVGHVRIDDVLNDAPNTAAFTVVLAPRIGPPETGPFAAHAFNNEAFNVAFNPGPRFHPPVTPTAGAPVALYLGAVDPASQIFGGQITNTEQFAEFDRPEHKRYHVSCIDHVRRLNRRKVLKAYGTASATDLVLDLIAWFAPWITVAHVQPGLPTVTGGITFTFEEPSRALSRLAEAIGAYWYIDYAGDLHFFTGNEPGADPAPIVPGADFADLRITADLTQVRTRILVEGAGSTVLATVPAGDPILPIAVSDPFSAAGGGAVIGTARATYTGVHDGGVKRNTVGIGTAGNPPPDPPGAPTAAAAGPDVPGKLAGGPYVYAVTLELGDGARSAVGPVSNPVTIAPALAPPPTNAALPSTPMYGPILPNVTATYATTFVGGGGETTATAGGNVITGRAVSTPPGAPTFTWINGGRMAVGVYDYALTFLTAGGGETLPVTAKGQVLAGFSGVRIWLIPTGADNRIVARRIYRSNVDTSGNAPLNPPILPWRHVIDIPNNLAGQEWNDLIPDAELSTASVPNWNTATDVGEGAIVTVPTSTDPRVQRRRLYRKDGPRGSGGPPLGGGGEYRLVTEIPDNVATTYNDVSVGPGGALAPFDNTLTGGAIHVTAIPLGPAGTVRRRVFRTAAGATELRELTAIGNNTTTAIVDASPDATLGGSPLPAQGGEAGAPPPTAIGATQLQLSDVTGIPAAGWVAVESQMIRYAGVAAPYLTGIPAAGPGAITAAIPAGTVVTTSPALVGVAPVAPVALGDPVQLLVQRDDLAAQAALAAIDGGDGIIEHYIQDRRLSVAGAAARGDAELALFKTVETRLHYTTHDPNTRSGRTVHIDLPAPTSITGDFLIQQVTIDDVSIANNWNPRRTVDASTTRFSFDDVLNRLLLESH